jgi:hypothetical protein
LAEASQPLLQVLDMLQQLAAIPRRVSKVAIADFPIPSFDFLQLLGT